MALPEMLKQSDLRHEVDLNVPLAQKSRINTPGPSSPAFGGEQLEKPLGVWFWRLLSYALESPTSDKSGKPVFLTDGNYSFLAFVKHLFPTKSPAPRWTCLSSTHDRWRAFRASAAVSSGFRWEGRRYGKTKQQEDSFLTDGNKKWYLYIIYL